MAGLHRTLQAAAFVIAALMQTNFAAAQEGPGAQITEEFALPALADLVEAADKLASSASALCAAPGEAALEATRADFAELVAGWGRASVLRFGPLAAENRFERIFFWPDPRGIAIRQVQQVLAEKDQSAATAQGVAEKSVALQGIPGLEFAIHGTGSEELTTQQGGFRCRYAVAVAQNIADVAEDVLGGWTDTPFATAFTTPAADTEPYRSASEVNGEIVKALGTTFQFIRAAELLPPLGDEPAKANGRRGPLWRSNLSFRLIAAQIEGARALLGVAGYRDTLPRETSWVADSTKFELDSALRALGEIEEPAEQAFRNEKDRGRLSFVNLALDHAGHLVSEQLSAALGLTMGFNALDGD